MEVANVEKGTNNGQAIVTLTDGRVFNLLGVTPVIVVSDKIITLTHPVTGQSFTLNFDAGTLNKQGQVSAQALVNHWADEDFFLRRGSGSAGTPAISDTDVATGTITIADQFTPNKSFSRILDVQVGNVPINLNRITFAGGIITFLDGAAIGENVKVIGTIQPGGCGGLPVSSLSPINTASNIVIDLANINNFLNQQVQIINSANITITLPDITTLTDGDQIEIISNGADRSGSITFIPFTGQQGNFNGNIWNATSNLVIQNSATDSTVVLRVDNGIWNVCSSTGDVVFVP